MDGSRLSYIISSFAPSSINDTVWKIRKRFHAPPRQEKKSTNSIITLDTAHITLKRRFYLKENVTDSAVVDLLKNITLDPIPVIANKFRVFPSKEHGNVLVAVVEKNDELRKLHNDILEALDPFDESNTEYEGDRYQPHLSIMYGVPDNQLDEVMQYSEQVLAPISYRLDNFYLLKNIQGIKKEREILYRYLTA